MIITANQMTALEPQALRTFERRLVDYIDTGFAGCRAHSGEIIPRGDELEARVHELIASARSVGITTELGVANFAVLGLGYARDFHHVPRVAEMLANTEQSPEQNIQRVLNAVIVAEARRAGCPLC
jgi:hypothetical protein